MNTPDQVLPFMPRPDSLRDQIVQTLREAITSGHFRPGEKLVERELCEQLAISRTSLREALRQLEAEKLVTIKLHRGPAVAVMSQAEARDLYAIRALLESFAVGEFTRRASDVQIGLLGGAVERLHKAAAIDDTKILLLAKAEFYGVILDGCGNALVKELLIGLLSRITLLRSTSFSRPERLQLSLEEIDQLLALIKRRNAPAALEAARQHIINAQEAALAVMKEHETTSSNLSLKEK